MERHKVAITPNAGGYGSHRITLDDKDISHGVRVVRFQLDPGEHAKVELEMAWIEMDLVEFETPHLYISDAAREALVALGWTPPATDADPVAVVLPARPEMESVITMHGRRYRIVGWDAYRDDPHGHSAVTLKLVPARDPIT